MAGGYGLASGIVRYGLGGSEVAMVFYFLMGLALVVERWARGETRAERGRLSSRP